MGTCPEILPQIALLISSYESSRSVQDDIQQALGNAARERLAQLKAKSLSETLGSDLDEIVKQEVQSDHRCSS